MTNTENLVLEHLKHIRGKVDIISEDMKDLKYRMNSIENAVGGLKRDTANTQDDVYHQNSVIDSIKERLNTIERRLEISQ